MYSASSCSRPTCVSGGCATEGCCRCASLKCDSAPFAGRSPAVRSNPFFPAITQSPGPSALLAWTVFFELFREQEALAAGLPSHLEQGSIEITNHAHDR